MRGATDAKLSNTPDSQVEPGSTDITVNVVLSFDLYFKSIKYDAWVYGSNTN